MSRSSFYRMSALNIVTHPHSPATYVQLFEDLAAMKNVVKVHGDTAILMSPYITAIDGDKTKGFTGLLYKFFDLNKDTDWADVNNVAVATDEQKKEIVIPDNLKPHLQAISFVFYPSDHILFFDSKGKQRSKLGKGDTNLSPRILKKYFEKYFQNDTIVEKYQTLQVHIIPGEEDIEKMLRIPLIKSVELIINLPNNDDLQSYENEYKNNLAAKNVTRKTIEYVGPQLLIDDDIKKEALVAAHNGRLTVRGKDEFNKPYKKSTSNAAFNEPYEVKDTEIDSDRLRQESHNWLQRIKNMFKK